MPMLASESQFTSLSHLGTFENIALDVTLDRKRLVSSSNNLVEIKLLSAKFSILMKKSYFSLRKIFQMTVFTCSIKYTLWINAKTKTALVKHHVSKFSILEDYYIQSFPYVLLSFSHNNSFTFYVLLKTTENLGNLKLRV